MSLNGKFYFSLSSHAAIRRRTHKIEANVPSMRRFALNFRRNAVSQQMTFRVQYRTCLDDLFKFGLSVQEVSLATKAGDHDFLDGKKEPVSCAWVGWPAPSGVTIDESI